MLGYDDHTITPTTPAPATAEPAVPTALTPKWQGHGLAIRVGAYMAGAHLFAAFLFLLFEVGARHAH